MVQMLPGNTRQRPVEVASTIGLPGATEDTAAIGMITSVITLHATILPAEAGAATAVLHTAAFTTLGYAPTTLATQDGGSTALTVAGVTRHRDFKHRVDGLGSVADTLQLNREGSVADIPQPAVVPTAAQIHPALAGAGVAVAAAGVAPPVTHHLGSAGTIMEPRRETLLDARTRGHHIAKRARASLQ